MDIIINNNDKTPIYEQISLQIREQIMNGTLEPGEHLPSMRLLAKELRISLITTKRAYEELEKSGFIESYTGKGSFVKSINKDLLLESVQKEIESDLEKVCLKAAANGISLDELKTILDEYYGR